MMKRYLFALVLFALCPMFNELSFWGTDINVTNLRIDAVKSIWE